jgi:hypothetical protein
MLERIDPCGTSMTTIEITLVSNRTHRDEDDGLTHEVKFGLIQKYDTGPVERRLGSAAPRTSPTA